MDEPTAGVDAAGQENLARTLMRLVGQGLTLVVVTHEIEPLLGLLTRVVELREGRVVRDQPLASGPPAGDLDVATERA
jgi:zinc transport system ATP-binding protein